MLKIEDFIKIKDYKFKHINNNAIIYIDDINNVEPESLKQLLNVSKLPGLVGYAIAMPDIHWGYGFPIGCVACTDYNEDGVISPGGIGFDINCGVRLLRTNLKYDEIKKYKEKILDELFKEVPSGLSSESDIKLSKSDFKKAIVKGVNWALNEGYANKSDINFIEDNGYRKDSSFDYVSQEAIERGKNQLGTLGSGNHFLEIQVVDEIYDEFIAKKLNLFKEQVVLMIHCGSRGFGHQIATDFINLMLKVMESKYKIKVEDKQLACVPANSEEGKKYIYSMNLAANFAFINRQIITYKVRKVFKKILNVRDIEIVYDISHNMAAIEDYVYGSKKYRLVMHRKGATRALPPFHPALPDEYKEIGQPVLIPGDMGRYSFILVGTQTAYEETFGHTCHGAGRVKSRNQAKKTINYNDLIKELESKGISIRAASKATVVEEAPQAYKDAMNVVDIVHNANISKKVAKLRPIGVVKG
ncbi:MAG: RtcB family protein [bacterium]|jgi:tRNA-splicing ligase RtcB